MQIKKDIKRTNNFYSYLQNLQKEYHKYKIQEDQIRQFFDSYFVGGVNRITLENDIVRVETTETSRGFTYQETYNILFVICLT